MKVQFTLLALALGMVLAAPAYAEGDDADIHSSTNISNNIGVAGRVWVKGKIRVASESAATVDQDQTTTANESLGDGDHTAHLGGSALSDAQGNIGANVAAGVGNTQANDTALSAVDGPVRATTVKELSLAHRHARRRLGEFPEQLIPTATSRGWA
mgnify:CR=1 FL=1